MLLCAACSVCCSVEELDQPELKSKPMAVGGMGMISTANYEVCVWARGGGGGSCGLARMQ